MSPEKDLIKHYLFQHQHELTIDEGLIDFESNHMTHLALLELFERTRDEILGTKEVNDQRVIAEESATFRKPIKRGDSVTLITTINLSGSRGILFEHQILVDEKEAVRAKILQIFVDEKGNGRSIPQDVVRKISSS
jgi:acyl-CoA thioesterase FadM